MTIYIFVVWPTRQQFRGFIRREQGDIFNEAYRDAHTRAAMLASERKCEAFVTPPYSDDRCGFYPSEYHDKQSTLRHIMTLGYRSYWDFQTQSWRPLQSDPQADEGHVIARRLLPPPKKLI